MSGDLSRLLKDQSEAEFQNCLRQASLTVLNQFLRELDQPGVPRSAVRQQVQQMIDEKSEALEKFDAEQW